MAVYPGSEDILIHSGGYFTAEWYYTRNGDMPGYDHYKNLSEMELIMKHKVKSLLERKKGNPDYRKRHEESYELLKLGIQILNILEKKHMTYSDLAKAMHTQKSNISRDLKGGGIKNASLSRIQKIADAIGMKFLPIFLPKRKANDLLPKIHRLVMA